jgi:hypothetical protein
MSLTDARVLLARAENPADRRHAVTQAMAAGMPLHEIEEFLDWADAVRAGRVAAPVSQKRSALYSLIRMADRGHAE